MIKVHPEKLAEAQVQAIQICEVLGTTVVSCKPTGSAYYGKECPADYDALLFVRGSGLFKTVDLEDFAARAEDFGWSDCGKNDSDPCSGGEPNEYEYYSSWVALRKGEYNAIITTDRVFYLRMAAAAELVKSQSFNKGQALDKEEVVSIFRAVREGE